MGRDDMRAGDGDRQAVADKLKTALDEGRLDLHEYDERLQQTYAAKTYGDLDGLLTDLPTTVPVQHSRMAAYQPPASPAASSGGGGSAPWANPYTGVVVVCVLIWAITSASAGQLTYFWPVWVMIPLILGLFRHGTGRSSGATAGDRDARRAARRARRDR